MKKGIKLTTIRRSIDRGQLAISTLGQRKGTVRVLSSQFPSIREVLLQKWSKNNFWKQLKTSLSILNFKLKGSVFHGHVYRFDFVHRTKT